MSDIMTIPAAERTRLGTAECRRLRRENVVPGNLYGHQKGPRAIKIKSDDLMPALRAGQQVIDLDIDGDVETAIFQDVQWDTFSTHVQHVDLIRVDKDERVSVEIPIELRGQAPGSTAGGVLDQQIYAFAMECPAVSVIDSIEVKIVGLQIDDAIYVKDLEIPPGATHEYSPDDVVVQVTPPIEVELPDADGPEDGQVEVIGEDGPPIDADETSGDD